MGWFKRIKKGVTTETNQKKEIPEGLWYKCPKCKTIITSEYTINSIMFVIIAIITTELMQGIF